MTPLKRFVFRDHNRSAFTLTEMMIAMAVTMLLMAALGKTFALMGESIREGRVKVDLTSQLRDITLRINNDLQRCTVPLAPSADQLRGDGYFVYYEGPLSDASGLLMGRSPSSTNENSYQDSKIGDLDDYIAFTSVAESGNWFRGKVPRFVLDAKTAEVNGRTYAPADFPGNPWDPIVITSKYAEIIYFASPEYITGTDQDDASELIFSYNGDSIGNPQYIDDDSNGLPDRVRMHRRVLLIRPDLNLSAGTLATFTHTFGSETVNF
ncbi:MAG: prepilin-type N-terminal cleavage/methylation domain-containing protein, partial [Pirellulaceae bacterium]|nr:prepilin-type N-terminal cleavage/methylation domain-containing protein [Pirellulaceae bacterium]